MIEFKHFIYLDVNRTGSTHIIEILRKISETKERHVWRHYPVSAAGFLVRPAGRPVFASVRNPWSWYVSLWGHGLDGHSAIRRFMADKLSASEVAEFYDEDQPAVSFRKWLTAIHDPGFADRVLKEGYPQSGLAPILGLYSYRFLRITTLFPWFHLRPRNIPDPARAVEFLRRRRIYQTMLHTENLTEEFAAFVKEHGPQCHFKPDAERTVRTTAQRKRNASTKALPHYRDYYDDRCAALVAERDRLFLDEFGYRF